MKIFKRIITISIFALLIVIMSKTNVKASSDLYLDNLDFQAQINPDGSMQVTENWDIDIEDTNTLYKTFIKDSSKYSGITDVQVVDTTNGSYKQLNKDLSWSYHMEEDSYFGGMNDDGKFEIAWGVGLENDSEQRQYQISYTVEDVISKYSDYAELYWQFVGEDFEISAEKITGRILLPQNASNKEDVKVWGHTEDLNGEIYVTDTNKIEFTLNDFRSGKYIEIRTLFPTEMITLATRTQNTKILDSVITEETQWANDANQRRAERETQKTIMGILVAVITLAITALLVKSALKKSQENKEKVKIIPSIDLEYFREVPRDDATPAEALYLFKKQKNEFNSEQIGKIFSATLLDLALKEVIKFEMLAEKKNVKIIIINENVELQGEEKEIFKFLKSACGEEKEIIVKDLEKYIKKQYTRVIALKEKIDKLTLKDLQDKKLINEKEYKDFVKYTCYLYFVIVGIIFLITGSIFLITGIFVAEAISVFSLIGMIPLIISMIIYAIVLKGTLNKINVYPQEGVDEIEKWKGLKKFMEDFSMLDKREVPELVLWEKFLVYATVFGIADKVLKQLKIVYPDMENLDLATYSYMNLMIHTNFANSFSNSISSAMSTSYSSATGGGGGFSGGGGGGRRPEVAVEVDN